MAKGKLSYKEIKLPRPDRKRPYPISFFDRLLGSPLMRGAFKRWSAHGLVPVALGALLVIEGHLAVLIRGVAVLVCAAWLALDIGVELSEKKWSPQFKGIAFSLLAALCFVAAMGCMYWILVSTLEKQQNDTYARLTAQVENAPSRDVMETFFTVTNNGNASISENTSCLTNLIVADGGYHYIYHNLKSMFFEFPILKGGGDSQSVQCLVIWRGYSPVINCVDVSIQASYALTTQPDVKTEKSFRFVGMPNYLGEFTWVRQNVGYGDTAYCAKYLKVPLPKI
jgi:hypothetical protein